MTLREAAANIVVEKNCVYTIIFNGNDKTELDADNIDELEEVWREFCKDNKIPEDCVDFIM